MISKNFGIFIHSRTRTFLLYVWNFHDYLFGIEIIGFCWFSSIRTFQNELFSIDYFRTSRIQKKVEK